MTIKNLKIDLKMKIIHSRFFKNPPLQSAKQTTIQHLYDFYRYFQILCDHTLESCVFV